MTVNANYVEKLANLNGTDYAPFNRKLCFEARDLLSDCVATHENGNKFRCPDELYAYEQWCPADVQKAFDWKRLYDKENAEMFR